MPGSNRCLVNIFPILPGSNRCLVNGPRDKRRSLRENIMETKCEEFSAALRDILPICVLASFSEEGFPILKQRLDFGSFLELDSRLGHLHSSEPGQVPWEVSQSSLRRRNLPPESCRLPTFLMTKVAYACPGNIYILQIDSERNGLIHATSP